MCSRLWSIQCQVRYRCLHFSPERILKLRSVGLALSQGSIATLLKRGMTEEEIGLEAFRSEAERMIGPTPCVWYWSYRIRLGVK